MRRVDIPDNVTQAERKLSGSCIECDGKGYIYVMFTGQASPEPYKQVCHCCPEGQEWKRRAVHGIK